MFGLKKNIPGRERVGFSWGLGVNWLEAVRSRKYCGKKQFDSKRGGTSGGNYQDKSVWGCGKNNLTLSVSVVHLCQFICPKKRKKVWWVIMYFVHVIECPWKVYDLSVFLKISLVSDFAACYWMYWGSSWSMSVCLFVCLSVCLSSARPYSHTICISMGKGRKTHSSTSFQELLFPFYDLGLYFKFQSNPMWPYYGRHLPPYPPRSRSTDSRFRPCLLLL